MAETNDPICFQCGQPSRSDRFNRLLDGRKCPTCCERLLATLPPLFPGGARMQEPSFTSDVQPDFDDDVPA